LFRKVLFGELPPFRLVRLSNDSLGSRELARWHEPEMVKVCFCDRILFLSSSAFNGDSYYSRRGQTLFVICKF